MGRLFYRGAGGGHVHFSAKSGVSKVLPIDSACEIQGMAFLIFRVTFGAEMGVSIESNQNVGPLGEPFVSTAIMKYCF